MRFLDNGIETNFIFIGMDNLKLSKIHLCDNIFLSFGGSNWGDEI